MKSFTGYQARVSDLINNSQGTNLIWATELINDSLRYLVTKYYFNERTYTVPGGTQAQVQFYNLPPQVQKIINLTIIIGNVKWQPVEVPTRAEWDRLNVIQFYQDFPSRFFVFNGQVGIFPIPSSSGNAMTINYKTRIQDLAQADVTDTTSGANVFVPYTFTTTATPANGSTTFTLSNAFPFANGTYAVTFANLNSDTRAVYLTGGLTSGTWTTALTGTATTTQTLRNQQGADFVSVTGGTLVTFNRWMANSGWIRIPSSTTDTANGDNQWYQIASIGTQITYGTMIVLANQYQGSTVAGGKFTVGDFPILPEDYQDLPLYRMANIYYTTRFPDPGKAQLYEGLWQKGMDALDEAYNMKTTNIVLNETDAPQQNPNLFQRSVSQA